MSQIHSSRIPIAILTLSILLTVVSGHIQRIVLYESEKDGGDFIGLTRQGVEDISKLFLNGVIKRICARGWWLLYNGTKYESFWKAIGPTGCTVENYSKVRSLRRIGGKDTAEDVISLYEKENYEGNQTTVMGRVKGNIPQPIKSLGRTGAADFTLYEEPDFDSNPSEKSYCLRGTASMFSFSRDILGSFGLSGIGSVAKGCK